jgi:hypothetical protein
VALGDLVLASVDISLLPFFFEGELAASAHTHAPTHIFSLSLSLFLTHTHTVPAAQRFGEALPPAGPGCEYEDWGCPCHNLDLLGCS